VEKYTFQRHKLCPLSLRERTRVKEKSVPPKHTIYPLSLWERARVRVNVNDKACSVPSPSGRALG